MKTPALILFLIVTCICPHGAMAQARLNAGDSITVPIDTALTLSGTTQSSLPVFQNVVYTLNYDATTLGPGDTLLWQFAGASGTLTSANPQNSNISAPWNGLNGQQALIGAPVTHVHGDLTLTMQSGSLVVDSLFIGFGNPTSRNTIDRYTATVAVPEPGAVSLLCVGGLLLPLARRFGRRRQ